MPTHILVPFDGSPQAESALTFAVDEWPDASFTLLYVVDPVTSGLGQRALPGSSENWYEHARETGRAQFDEARELVRHPVDTRIEVGKPARVVVDVAEAGPFDHVVVGSHGREGVTRILLGSVAEEVVRRSPVPVTVVR
ncbi:universal stress protein [Haloplanus halobius]|uniref:universal stress protein n=1 Tax=Haloplanus halobius TaxID=2934938 RepID=UPI0020103B80|nr:universal stress protein [Haloplanus sp. XH21]